MYINKNYKEIKMTLVFLSVFLCVYMLTQYLMKYVYIGFENWDKSQEAMKIINPLQWICLILPIFLAIKLGGEYGFRHNSKGLLSQVGLVIGLCILTIIISKLLNLPYIDTLFIPIRYLEMFLISYVTLRFWA